VSRGHSGFANLPPPKFGGIATSYLQTGLMFESPELLGRFSPGMFLPCGYSYCWNDEHLAL